MQIHVTAPPGLAGINTTTLTWDPDPEPNLAGYEVASGYHRRRGCAQLSGQQQRPRSRGEGAAALARRAGRLALGRRTWVSVPSMRSSTPWAAA